MRSEKGQQFTEEAKHLGSTGWSITFWEGVIASHVQLQPVRHTSFESSFKMELIASIKTEK
jgi:hypothetical protein